MDRRSFMQAILASSTAPAIVKAASLMPIRRLESGLALLDMDRVAYEAAGLAPRAPYLFTVPDGVRLAWFGLLSPHSLEDHLVKAMPVEPGQVVSVAAGTRVQYVTESSLVAVDYQ